MKNLSLIIFFTLPLLKAGDVLPAQEPAVDKGIISSAQVNEERKARQFDKWVPQTKIPDDVSAILKLRIQNIKQQIELKQKIVDMGDGRYPREVELLSMLQIALMKLERDEAPTLKEKLKIQKKICDMADQSMKRVREKCIKSFMGLPDYLQIQQLSLEAKQDLLQLQGKSSPKV